MDLKISLATISDLATLRALSIRTFHDAFASVNTEENMRSYVESAFNEEKLREELTNPDSRFFFCYYETTPIGYMKINFAPAQTDLHDPGSLELERIYILKDYQNLKAGAFLLEHCVSIALEHNLRYIWLGVWEHNTRAINFYEKNGFSAIDTHAFMLGTDRQIDVIMKRDLAAQ
jgi:diamine N-acetyltransferase